MKAAVIHEFGDVDVLKYEEIDTAKPQPGHVLVKVLATFIRELERMTGFQAAAPRVVAMVNAPAAFVI